MKKQKLSRLLGVLLIIFASFSIYLESTSIRVNPTESVVFVSSFSDKPEVKGPGKWYKYPWEKVHLYNLSPAIYRNEIEILDKDKNHLIITLVARFSPALEDLESLHEEMGTGYESDFVIPQIIQKTRSTSSNYNAEEIWAIKRSEFELELKRTLKNELSRNHIDLKSFTIVSIDLPVKLERLLIKKSELEEDCVFNNDIKSLSIEAIQKLDSSINFNWDNETKEVSAIYDNDTIFVSIGGCNHFNFTAKLKSIQNFDDTVFWLEKAKWLANMFFWKQIGEDYAKAIEDGRLIKDDNTSNDKIHFMYPPDTSITNIYKTGITITKIPDGTILEVGAYVN